MAINELYEDSITQLASEGRLTLQVPDTCIGLPEPGTVTVNPSHFVILKSADGPPSVGRESGFLYFSEAGFEHYKADLEAAFDTEIRGHSWKHFEEYARSVFLKRKKKLQAAIRTAELRVQRLKEHQ